jgi:hypothetical protein
MTTEHRSMGSEGLRAAHDWRTHSTSPHHHREDGYGEPVWEHRSMGSEGLREHRIEQAILQVATGSITPSEGVRQVLALAAQPAAEGLLRAAVEDVTDRMALATRTMHTEARDVPNGVIASWGATLRAALQPASEGEQP